MIIYLRCQIGGDMHRRLGCRIASKVSKKPTKPARKRDDRNHPRPSKKKRAPSRDKKDKNPPRP